MSQTIICPNCGSEIPEGTPDARCPKCMLRAGLGDESSLHAFEGDKNLLFGVFAVQLGKVTPQEIMAAAGAWAADTTKDIPTRLLQQNILSQADVEFIARLVDEAVRAHGGDLNATMHTLGGDQVLQATYGNSVDLSRYRFGAAEGMPVYLDTKPLDPDAVPGVQETPGRYTHVSEHARGGMGRVLLVHDGFLGRNVALKELMPGTRPASDPENPSTPVRQYMGFLSRFLQEARITGQLEHPSIVPVYELGHRQDGTLYYTMKLVRGKTLREAIAQCKTTQDRLALLAHFVDLCQALAYAHSRGIIHRDIKPDNVMVGEFGETVVLDWGLAKAKDKEDVHADGLAETIRMLQLGDVDSALKTQYGQVMGTPSYMSPEQALGRMAEVDERSDVYSLGTVLYQMLAGHPPFTGKSVPEILQKVVDDEPEPLDPNTIPPELAAICMKAMSKRAESRYPSASAMADEVRRFQTGAIVQAYVYGFGHHLKRFAAKHKAVLTTAAAALIALLALAGYSYLNVREARDVAESKRIEAETQREEARSAKAESDKQRDIAQTERDAADTERKRAEHSAYVAGISAAKANFDVHNVASVRHQLIATPAHLRNWEWGYLYRAMDTSLFTLPNVAKAAYSRHGNRILTSCTDKTAKVWDAEKGSLLLTLTGHNGDINDVQYSVDGKRIVTASADKTARIWDAETGVELLTLPGEEESIALAVFDRDRRRVLTASQKWIRIWDAQTGEKIRELPYDSRQILNAKFAGDGNVVYAHSNQNREGMDYPEFPWVALEYKVWDATTGKELFTRPISGNTPWTACISRDGTRVVAATLSENALDGECATVWSVNGERLRPLKAQNHGSITGANFSTDGKHVVTCNWDGSLKIWDAETGKDLQTLPGHALDVNSAEFSLDSKYVATASRDTTAKLWDAETGALLQTLAGHVRSVRLAVFRPDGKQILTTSEDNTAKVWSVNTAKESAPAKITELQVDLDTNIEPTATEGSTISDNDAEDRTNSPDGTKFIAISKNGKGRICDAKTGEELHRLSGELVDINEVRFFPDGLRVMILFYKDKPTRIWDTQTGQELTELESALANNGIKSELPEFSPDGKRIAFSLDGVTKLVEADSGAISLTLTDCDGSVTFSPDGSRIMAGGHHKPTKVWDASTGEQLFTLPSTGDEFHVFFMRSFSPDGRRICGTVNGNIGKIWDGFTGKEICTLAGHTDRIIQTSFSRDSTRILTWSPDATLRLWDVETGAELVSLAAQPFFMHFFNGVTTTGAWAEFSQDGRTLHADDTFDDVQGLWTAAPWKAEDWLDESLRAELVRLALRNAPELHEITLSRAKGEVEPVLNALESFANSISATTPASTDVRGIEGQGIYIAKGPIAVTQGMTLAEEDLVVGVNAYPVTNVETLAKAISAFVSETRALPERSHVLCLDVVNRYDRDQYTIAAPRE